MFIWQGIIAVGELEIDAIAYYPDPANDKPVIWMGTGTVPGGCLGEGIFKTSVGNIEITRAIEDAQGVKIEFVGLGLPRGALAAAMGLE